MILTLLSFGQKLETHQQACFSILSFLTSSDISKVCVVTDYPEAYEFLSDRLHTININPDDFKTWRGKYDFFWRIKMTAILKATEQFPNEHILYVDSDTFYQSGLCTIKLNLDKGYSYMHEFERDLSGSIQDTDKEMRAKLSGNSYSNIKISEKSEMWNAGVIALPRSRANKLVLKAIEVCDAMCATGCYNWLLEQFAFSLVLKEETTLLPAENQIIHYWGNKNSWNNTISQFFMESRIRQSSLSDEIDRLSSLDLTSIPTVLIEKSTKLRLERLSQKLLKPKLIRYFKPYEMELENTN